MRRIFLRDFVRNCEGTVRKQFLVLVVIGVVYLLTYSSDNLADPTQNLDFESIEFGLFQI